MERVHVSDVQRTVGRGARSQWQWRWAVDDGVAMLREQERRAEWSVGMEQREQDGSVIVSMRDRWRNGVRGEGRTGRPIYGGCASDVSWTTHLERLGSKEGQRSEKACRSHRLSGRDTPGAKKEQGVGPLLDTR